MNQPQPFRAPRPTSATPDIGDGLASSVSRVGALSERGDLHRAIPAEGGWLRCSDLLAEPVGFEHWRKQLSEWLNDQYRAAPARTAASYVMSWYLHVPAHVGALLFHHERRVPSLRPEELAFSLGGDRPHPEGMAVLGDAFYCLPTDPGSTRPEATIVRDEHALAAVLRAHYIAHAARFVRAYAPGSRLGKRMLWAAATDALDNSLWWAGKQAGTAEGEGAGVADASLVLESRFPPLTAPSTLRMETGADGHREWNRRRESCCFSYLLPQEAECDGCPRTCPKN
ncbi:(2Fe-2S)-binding protein [Amycolatopsis sp. H20-H5]|uniref:(2Fe-2S)-binding protein n=1 Tax=Amycolatopsis sp. H20-H5 TaxID=3046309 RepID=UPI002DB9787E|nr:(2Fe-2S)-binding protein [Amycolatopsis sp. H20-H5]MEC3982203.1 (2Fe-2S)-binding protein [Amycolatopsis sp. H20-H5]